MSQRNAILIDPVRTILDGPHLSVLATTNPDGRPQTSVIFVKRDDDAILFSTIKGRRKLTNMLQDRRVNLLVHTLPVGDEAAATSRSPARVEISDDPDGSFRDVIYNLHMGGATAPPRTWSRACDRAHRAEGGISIAVGWLMGLSRRGGAPV